MHRSQTLVGTSNHNLRRHFRALERVLNALDERGAPPGLHQACWVSCQACVESLTTPALAACEPSTLSWVCTLSLRAMARLSSLSTTEEGQVRYEAWLHGMNDGMRSLPLATCSDRGLVALAQWMMQQESGERPPAWLNQTRWRGLVERLDDPAGRDVYQVVLLRTGGVRRAFMAYGHAQGWADPRPAIVPSSPPSLSVEPHMDCLWTQAQKKVYRRLLILQGRLPRVETLTSSLTVPVFLRLVRDHCPSHVVALVRCFELAAATLQPIEFEAVVAYVMRCMPLSHQMLLHWVAERNANDPMAYQHPRHARVLLEVWPPLRPHRLRNAAPSYLTAWSMVRGTFPSRGWRPQPTPASLMARMPADWRALVPETKALVGGLARCQVTHATSLSHRAKGYALTRAKLSGGHHMHHIIARGCCGILCSGTTLALLPIFFGALPLGVFDGIETLSACMGVGALVYVMLHLKASWEAERWFRQGCPSAWTACGSLSSKPAPAQPVVPSPIAGVTRGGDCAQSLS